MEHLCGGFLAGYRRFKCAARGRCTPCAVIYVLMFKRCVQRRPARHQPPHGFTASIMGDKKRPALLKSGGAPV